MKPRKKMLPVGVDNFEMLIKGDYYYVDKTGLICELADNLGYVNLFTRPRRFGKSLNMSMLEHFFAPGTDKSVFEGLKVSENARVCEAFMGKYPVVALSLKDIEANDYDTAFGIAALTVRRAVQKHERELLMSKALSASQREDLLALLNLDMSEQVLRLSLRSLTELLETHYGNKVIILIDEYDVPLAKAYEHGYYDKMALLLALRA